MTDKINKTKKQLLMEITALKASNLGLCDQLAAAEKEKSRLREELRNQISANSAHQEEEADLHMRIAMLEQDYNEMRQDVRDAKIRADATIQTAERMIQALGGGMSQ